MGYDAEARICYGISFDDDYEFPWEQYCEDEWWRQVGGFTPTKRCYSEEGRTLPGITEEDIDLYFEERRAWDKANPMPFELIRHGSDEYTLYIIAVKGTEIDTEWGDALKIRPDNMRIPYNGLGKLVDFCEKYGIEFDAEKDVGWWLSAYYG